VRTLQRQITALGWLNLVCFALAAWLSYGLAAAVPNIRDNVVGPAWLADRRIWTIVIAVPLLISSVVFVRLLVVLARADVDASVLPRVFRWSCLFAAVSVFATPVVVLDFWFYAVWGRMVAAGQNPYLEVVPVSMLAGTPFQRFTTQHMPYGPLWAVISGGAAWLSGHSALALAFILKLVFAGAWMASLLLIRSLTAHLPLRTQAVSMAMFGWLPLSVNQTVAEGHNDIVMVLFVLLWIWCLRRAHPVSASAFLALSVLTKYATAPLFAFDALHAWLSRRRISAYIPSAIAAAVIAGALALPFFHSLDAFSGTREVSEWHFYTPDVAVWALEEMTIEASWIRRAVRLSFPLMALVAMVRYVQTRDETRLLGAVSWTLAAILFSVIGHLWPWYLVWLLGVAVLVPWSALTRFAIGVCLVAPFVILPRTVAEEAGPFLKYRLPTLVMYALVLAWFIWVPRRWLSLEPVAAEASHGPPHHPPAAVLSNADGPAE
jgi:alpha-1,6-mannosyltransferase